MGDVQRRAGAWMYSITDIGEAYLDLWVEALEQYRRTIDSFFRLYAGMPQRTNEGEDR